MKLSHAQVGEFWKLFGRAWRVYAAGTGDSGEEAKHAWRKEQLVACGFESLTDVDRTHGYDRIMYHFAQLAGDEAKAVYFAVAVERRMRHLIGEQLVKLSNMAGHLFDWKYARGIMDHMHLPESIEDTTADQLLAVFEALDTYRRRMKRKAHPHAPDHHDGHHEEAA